MVGRAWIGCSSWTSPAWAGRLYPNGIKEGDRLAYYARLYDTVEVDSTYYRDPGPYLFRRWASVTPPGFRFAVKFPRDLLDPTQNLKPEAVRAFLTNCAGLGTKLGPVLLQFPPWVRPGRAIRFLEGLLDLMDPRHRYSVELRSKEWFEGATWKWLTEQLRDRHVALTWSYLSYVDIPAELTTDFVYLRFIGDHHTVPEAVHGEVRVERDREIRRWIGPFRAALGSLEEGFVFFNNHFQGFAPASVNLFRTAMDLLPVPYSPGG